MRAAGTNVWIALPYGMSARNLLRSSFWPAWQNLQRQWDWHTVLLSPLAKDSNFAREFSSLETTVANLPHDFPLWTKALTKALVDAESYAWPSRSRIDTFSIVEEKIRLGYAEPVLDLYHGIFSMRSRVLGRLPSVRGWLRERLLPHLYSSGELESLRAQFPPSLILFTHGYASEERALGFLAEKHRVPTIGLIHSWDSLTSCPKMLFEFDRIAVWSSTLKGRLMDLYSYPEHRIDVIGMPQMDLASQEGLVQSRPAFLRGMGLDPGRRVVTYACATPALVRGHFKILETLCRMIQDPALPYPCQLVVRMHPGKPGLAQGSEERQIRDLAGKYTYVAIDEPSAAFAALPVASHWDSKAQDQAHFFNLLKHSDMLVNCFSTTTLDAAIFNCPIINIAFDAEPVAHPCASWTRYYGETHYQPVLRSGGVALVKNPEELLGAVRRYLLDRTQDEEGRERIVREQCGTLDGKSGERLANLVESHMRTHNSCTRPVSFTTGRDVKPRRRVAIMTDHKWRDLPGYVLLKEILERAHGCSVTLYPRGWEHEVLPTFRPHLVLFSNLYSPNEVELAYWACSHGVRVGLLPTEGIPSVNHPRYLAWAAGADTDLAPADLHFTWSEEMCAYSLRQGVSPDKVLCIRPPRFDVYHETFKGLRTPRQTFLKRYGLDPSRSTVTWTTNFTYVDYLHGVTEEVFRLAGLTPEILGCSVSAFVQERTRSRLNAASAVKKFLRTARSCNFIIKPHPAEGPHFYLDLARELRQEGRRNVAVVTQEYIWDVLESTDILLHRNCTTAVEAWFLERPTLELQLNSQDPLRHTERELGSDLIETPEGLTERVEYYLQGGAIPFGILDGRKQFIDKWCGWPDGGNTAALALRIMEFLDGTSGAPSFGGLERSLARLKLAAKKIYYRRNPSRVIPGRRGGIQLQKVIVDSDVEEWRSRLQASGVLQALGSHETKSLGTGKVPSLVT